MLRVYRFILFVIVCSLFFSCKENYTIISVLNDAEKQLMQNPDSVLFLLSSIPEPTTLSESEYAQYCLLNSAAKFRMYEPQSDSMISMAVKYYEKHGTKVQKARARYYMGSILEESGDAIRAQSYFFKSLDEGHDIMDASVLGRINARIAMLYMHQDAYKASIPYHKKALDYFAQEKDTRRQSYVLRDLGRVYLELMPESPDSAIFYYREALLLAEEDDRQSFSGELGHAYLVSKRYDEAYEYLASSLANWSEGWEPHHLYFSLGKLYYLTGNMDSSSYYLTKSIERSDDDKKIEAYSLLVKMAESKDDEMSKLQKEYIEILENQLKNTLTESVLKVDKLYNYQNAERALSEAKILNAKRKIIILICVAAIILLLLFSVLIFNYLKKERTEKLFQRQRYKELIEEIKRNSSLQVAKNKQYIIELETQLAKKEKSERELVHIYLEKEKVEIENKRIEYTEKENACRIKELRISDIYQRFHGNCEWTVSDEDWMKLKVIIDETYPKFFERLQSLLPRMSDLEQRVCYLVKIQLPMQNIAWAIKRSKQSVTMIRRRLYEKIYGKSASAKDFDDFIASL